MHLSLSLDDPSPDLAFLLYLNDATFTQSPHPDSLAQSPHSDPLAAEVRRALEAKVPFILVHERDPLAGGCDFSTIIDATPKDIVSEGLFDQYLATPLYPNSRSALYREVSLKLLSRDLATRLCTKKVQLQ